MRTIGVFSIGLGISVAVTVAALLYLRNPLYATLVDLCDSSARARFWTALCNVVLCLVPIALSLGAHPSEMAWPVAFFEICGQIESALIGFSISVAILGWLLTRAIRVQTELRTGER